MAEREKDRLKNQEADESEAGGDETNNPTKKESANEYLQRRLREESLSSKKVEPPKDWAMAIFRR